MLDLKQFIIFKIIFFLFWTAPVILSARDDVQDPADLLFDQAQQNYAEGAYEKSARLFSSAAELFLKNDNLEQYLECLTASSRNLLLLKNNDSTIELMHKVIRLAEANYDQPHPSISVAYNRLAWAYSDLGYWHKALDVDLKNLDLVINLHGEFSNEAARAYYNLAHSYQFLNRYEKCNYYSEKAIAAANQQEMQERELILSRCYYLLGMNHAKKWDYEQALEYGLKSLEMTKAAFGESSLEAIKSYADISSNIYLNLNDYDMALEFQQKSMDLLNQMNPIPYDVLGKGLISLGHVYYAKNELDSAVRSLDKAKEIFAEHYPQHYNYITLLIDLAKIYEDQNQMEKALTYFRQAEQNYQKHFTPHPQQLANIYKHIGNHYHHRKEYLRSLEYYQKGVAALSIDQEFQDLMKTDIDFSKYHSPHFLVPLIQNKAETFYQLFRQDNKLEDLEAANHHYSLAIKGLDSIRINLQGISSKQYLLEYHYDLYEGLVETNLEIFKINRDDKYLEKAFQAIEQSRARILLEELTMEGVQKYAGIPSELTRLEHDLKTDITTYMGILAGSEKKDNDTPEIKTSQEMLFKHKRTQDSLHFIFKTRYPHYYQMKYDFQTPSIKQIQTRLSRQTSFLEYFLLDSTLLAFVINRNQIRQLKIPLSKSLDTLILKLRENIASGGLGQSPQQNLKEYTRLTYQIYQDVFAPVAALIGKKSNKLIIAPDGFLSLIPFELLIDKLPATEEGFKDLAYLVRKFDISYAPSATIWVQVQQRKTENLQQFAGYAPSYESVVLASQRESGQSMDPDENFTSLRYSQEEVRTAAKRFQGKNYLGTEATESAFKAQVYDCNIIHLALHGIVDDQNPLRSKLVFSPQNEPSEDGFLYAYELFNLQINAELVVLSACNTGYGKLDKGEGVMSLARAFAQAGSRSLVMSLWAANDQATSMIMDYFYQGLEQGMGKDEALRKAKIDYLNDADPLLAHPYYWGAFVANGDMNPLHEKDNYWKFFLIPALFLLGIYFLMRKGH